ncbi:arabinan endo-1,5-alpha-L-arabinosidase [Paenibacillus phyllosphaerae]|uniref:Arabinan endo-1,5-alpha-L-arabinosidase n=1 Tax=Paenibacillus phyllosphaerae TaxID=274593 RepID=A0A7W5FPJ9_9BACL|nr:family 43 glycosylhydrolase [Paenibacillus phyllosphaerae]MBB3112348.1 arabinan endo-1,5-alpha-L-arabinosidase [Paenibacillus phyllosphaerae]
MKTKTIALALLTAVFLSACSNNTPAKEESNTNNAASSEQGTDDTAATNEGQAEPVFQNVSVHDPSVVKVDDTYYVFGSHLASAKSNDLMSWEQISSGVMDGNVLIPNVTEELAETFAWAETDTLWAADVIQLEDGKFYMYYNACKGDSPRSALGVAVADNIEGPYKDLGIILKSGMWGEQGADGTIYDATIHPNVVDPDTFFDKDGNLWMVYGSYSGGIFILKMDPKTGMPYPDQGYGKKLLGGNHSRIEGPYMLYNPQTDYYYLFLSYGGLTADGAYNMRVARSKNPDGPFVDSEGKDLIDAMGAYGTTFDDASYAPYGAKLMGNFEFTNVEGEPAGGGNGYVSPGHNSAYYDEEEGKYYLIFHTRFPYRGEEHEVRVHQMFFNEDGWPVVAPHRYGGETIGTYEAKDITGDYKYVNHNKEITADIQQSALITLAEDGTVSGAVTGTWKLTDEHTAELVIDGSTYTGVFLREYDEGTLSYVITFTAMSAEGISIWGSHVAAE